MHVCCVVTLQLPTTNRSQNGVLLTTSEIERGNELFGSESCVSVWFDGLYCRRACTRLLCSNRGGFRCSRRGCTKCMFPPSFVICSTYVCGGFSFFGSFDFRPSLSVVRWLHKEEIRTAVFFSCVWRTAQTRGEVNKSSSKAVFGQRALRSTRLVRTVEMKMKHSSDSLFSPFLRFNQRGRKVLNGGRV